MKYLYILLVSTLLTSCFFLKKSDKHISIIKQDSCQIYVNEPLINPVDSCIYQPIEKLEQPIPVANNANVKPQLSSEKVKVNKLIYKKHKIRNIQKPIVNDVSIGQVLYQFPDTMKLFNVYNINVRIAKDTTVNELILTDLETNIEIKKSKIKVGSKIEVQLKNDIEEDPHFRIKKINSDIQDLDTLLYTNWSFRVEPIKTGVSQLNIVISIINGESKKEIVYTDKILVNNNITEKAIRWWETEWKWLFSTILIPIFVYFWKRNKNKKEENE